MSTKKRIKKKTYKEFISWLEGVESMQDEEWVPNSSQWKTIREMMNNVKPEEIEVSPPAIPQQRLQQHFPTEPVARIVEPPAGFRPSVPTHVQQVPPQSQLEPPKQPKVQPRPQPSGINQIPKVPTPKETLLTPGQEHQENEFL